MSVDISYTSPNGLPTVTMPSGQDLSTLDPLLPTELVHTIVEITLADFWSDLLLKPERVEDWNVVIVLLQVSQDFRSCTIKCIDPLWGGKLVEDGPHIKQTLSLLRRYSEVAKTSPEELSTPPVPPCAGHPLLQESQVPVVALLRSIIRGGVATRLRIKYCNRASLSSAHLSSTVVDSDAVKKFPRVAKSVLRAAVYDYMIEYLVPWSRASNLRFMMGLLENVVVQGREPELSALLLEHLHDSQVGNVSSILRSSTEFLSEVERLVYFPINTLDCELTTDTYEFPHDVWSSITAVLKALKVRSPDKAVVWERSLAFLMSTADREKLLPEVLLDAGYTAWVSSMVDPHLSYSELEGNDPP